MKKFHLSIALLSFVFLDSFANNPISAIGSYRGQGPKAPTCPVPSSGLKLTITESHYKDKNGQPYKWDEKWTDVIVQSLNEGGGKEIKEKFIDKDEFKSNPKLYEDIKKLCPRYEQASAEDRTKFWAVYMISISLAETGFRSGHAYWEAAFDNPEWSVGLFQLSQSNSNHGPDCKFTPHPEDTLEVSSSKGGKHSVSKKAVERTWLYEEKTVTDPIQNIKCAMQVMRNQIFGIPEGSIKNKAKEAKREKRLFPEEPFYWSVLVDKKDKLAASSTTEQAEMSYSGTKQEEGIERFLDAYNKHKDQLPFCK